MDKQKLIEKILSRLMETDDCIITDDHLFVIETILNEEVPEF